MALAGSVHWNPIFSGITSSSIWRQPDHVRLAWIAILANKDFRTHVVRTNALILSDQARISREKAEDALTVLCNPDRDSLDPAFEGRRLEKLPSGGYLVLNGDKYSKLMARFNKLVYDRETKRIERAKPKHTETKTKPAAASVSDPFDIFWSAYPLKKGKEDARKAFAKALKKTKVEVVLAAIAEQQGWPEWKKEDGKFIPHPATWLNRGGWSDEAAPGPDKRFVPGTDIAYFTAPIQPGEEDPFKSVRESVLGDEAKP